MTTTNNTNVSFAERIGTASFWLADERGISHLTETLRRLCSAWSQEAVNDETDPGYIKSQAEDVMALMSFLAQVAETKGLHERTSVFTKASEQRVAG
jgi:hypothetical protein